MNEKSFLTMPGSRCSSTGSLHTANSSPNNSDDDDSDGAMKSKCGNNCLKDKRREAHTQVGIISNIMLEL